MSNAMSSRISTTLSTPVKSSLPHIAKAISVLNLNDSRYKTWAMYDKRENRYWLSVIRPDGHTNTYVYTFLGGAQGLWVAALRRP
jgi:hypothetical protein